MKQNKKNMQKRFCWENQKLDLEQAQPLYRNFADHLMKCIASGELKAGTQIPPSRELQKYFHLSSITVEHGIRLLMRDGVLIRHPRIGTFVADASVQKARKAEKKRRIKVLFCNIPPTAEYWFKILYYLEQHFAEHKSEMLFEHIDLSRKNPDADEITGTCDGLVMCGTTSHVLAEKLLKRKFPFILIGSPDKKTPLLKEMDALIGDDENRFFNAVKLLLDMGHRKIAVLCTPQGSMFEQDQVNGVRKARKKFNLTDEEIEVISLKTPGIETGDRVTCELLSRKEPPSAILAVDSLICIGVLHAARRLGVSIPRELSLLSGSGGELIIEFSDPPITEIDNDGRIQEFLDIIINKLFDQFDNPLHIYGNVIQRNFNVTYRESLIRYVPPVSKTTPKRRSRK